MEGLAGVRDLDTAYRSVGVSPRWTVADSDEVTVMASGSAGQARVRLVDGVSQGFRVERIRDSLYAAVTVSLLQPATIDVHYR
ncbi:MAG TPA: hypothetical protein VMU80_12170 [Bryobacteraceae bacterium]|nr:hypothetical protein [Bryobacteraceae bacterium]